MGSPPEVQAGKSRLRLYIAGNSPNSVEARSNLRAICAEYALADGCIETVDVLEEPLRALEDEVFVTPTLVRLSCSPLRIVGNLRDRARVAQLLGLERREG